MMGTLAAGLQNLEPVVTGLSQHDVPELMRMWSETTTMYQTLLSSVVALQAGSLTSDQMQSEMASQLADVKPQLASLSTSMQDLNAKSEAQDAELRRMREERAADEREREERAKILAEERKEEEAAAARKEERQRQLAEAKERCEREKADAKEAAQKKINEALQKKTEGIQRKTEEMEAKLEETDAKARDMEARLAKAEEKLRRQSDQRRLLAARAC